jgi:hypothetical protein
MISISGAATIALYLIVAGLIFWLLWWLIDYVNPPQPFNKIAHVIVAILGVMVLIGILIQMIGGRPIFVP